MSARAVRKGEAKAPRGANAAAPRPVALAVRPAGPGDVVPLTFFFDTMLRKDYFLKRGQLEDILSGRHHQVYVAELDAILVGVAITTRGCRLVNVLVHLAYRGLGIGRELVRRSGASEVRVKVNMSAGDPRGFYKSLGFDPTGYFDQTGNIEVMRLRGGTNGNGRSGRAASRGRAAKTRRDTNGRG